MISVQSSTTAFIHEGKGFSYAGTGSLASSGKATFLGRTGGRAVHFHGFNVSVNKGAVLIELIESPTVSAVGTQQSPRNRNRNILDQSDMLLYSGSTVSGGTVIDVSKIHDIGGGSHTEGGDGGFNVEWVLKPSTDYAITVTNLDTIAGCDYSCKFFYYEL